MDADDPVARNRAANPRRSPGRRPLGDDTLRTVLKVAVAAVAAATVVLLAILAL